MKKIRLIIQREYLTRVRKKSFLVTTLLLPLIYLGFMFGTGYIAKQSASTLKIGVADQSGYFTDSLLKSMNHNSTLVFEKATAPADSLKNNFEKLGYTAYMIVPAFDWKNGSHLEIYSNKAKGEMTSAAAESEINAAWETVKRQKLGIAPEQQDALMKSRITTEIKNNNDKNASSKKASGIASVLAFLIYLIILIYGSQVMMGVMEEKTNRIAEVVVSSVKPFQLMMGKIIGIGLVALTQFLLWIVFILIIYNVVTATGGSTGASGAMIENMKNVFTGINVPLILVFFLLYFIGGFFFYASIYAAIGSAVNEDIRDAQQLSFPVTMLVIFSFFITIQSANDPSSGLAFWGSMIPFSSPLVMMSRIPYGVPGTVPWWQLIMSLVILYSSIVAIAWLSGRIYRTGILMYGKKVTLKEMLKWVFKKQ
jgi:ABC-2 type transport system permease protein